MKYPAGLIGEHQLMFKAAVLFALLIISSAVVPAEAHFFGETKQIDNYQIVFVPAPTIPIAGSNSILNFSVLENGTNIFGIYSAVVIAEKQSGLPVDQIPYRIYEFSDISIQYGFSKPGDYVVTLQTRIVGDEKYQAVPLEASFDLLVDSPGPQGIPIDELMLFYVTPSAVAIAGIAVYLHSKKRL